MKQIQSLFDNNLSKSESQISISANQIYLEIEEYFDQIKCKYIKNGSEIFVSIDDAIEKSVFIGYAKVESFEDNKIIVNLTNIQTNIFDLYTKINYLDSLDIEDIGNLSSEETLPAKAKSFNNRNSKINKSTDIRSLDNFKLRIDLRSVFDESYLSKN